jgi:CubicO group peptidase (beta-lactamase class C family)
MKVGSVVIGFAAAASLFTDCGKKPSPTPNPSASLPLDQRIEAIVQPLIDDGWAQGIMVGVLHDGKESYLAFGSITDKEATPPDENTVFEIGSITKVFTAITLAEMASKGEVALDDPLEKFLPGDIEIPSPGGKPITLESLAAHISGLPNVPANFWDESDNIYDNDVAGLRWSEYSEPQVRDYFKAPSPPLDDARKYVYSNLGAGLLGHALQRESGVPLEKLIVDHVCRPLGMESTTFSVEPTATGHDADGNPADLWANHDSILAGAFALRSTCKDLLAFAKANLDPETSPLEDALKEALESRAEINELERTALGWTLNKFGVIYTVGATGGFRCALFLHPQTKTAVVTMTNTQMGGVVGGRAPLFDALAGSLLNVTVGAPPIEIDFPSPKSSDEAAREDFVGVYRPEDGSRDPSLPIRAECERLMTIGPGGMEMQLWPKGDDAFFLRSYIADVKFLRDESGVVTGADLQFEGNQVRLKRFKE